MKPCLILALILWAAAPAAARFKQPISEYDREKLFFGATWTGQETLKGTLHWAWKDCDYPDLDGKYVIYFREQNFYFVPDKGGLSKLPGAKPYITDGNELYPTYGDERVLVTTIIPDTYKDGAVIPQTYTPAGPPEKIFGVLPEYFEEYEGGSVSMRVRLTLSNYFLEVYPGGGDRFEQSARITGFTLLPDSKSSLTLTSYRDDSYQLPLYKGQDSSIDIWDKPDGAVVHKIHKGSFQKGDIRLIFADMDNPWQKILYRNGEDFSLGYVRAGQLGFEP